MLTQWSVPLRLIRSGGAGSRTVLRKLFQFEFNIQSRDARPAAAITNRECRRPPRKKSLPYYAFSVTGVTIFQRQSGCLQVYRGVLKRTALTERKGIGQKTSVLEACGSPVKFPTLSATSLIFFFFVSGRNRQIPANRFQKNFC